MSGAGEIAADRKAIGRFETGLLCAPAAELGSAFAAFDTSVRFTAGGVRPTRLGALLAPFQTEEAARSALIAAGARLERIERIEARAGQ